MLESRLGYRFRDRARLELALTHSSRAHEEGGSDRDNERLEFLGDSVLDLLVSELLMRVHPDAEEGTLSRARAAVVSSRALAERARELDLGASLRLGRGERRTGGSGKSSILAGALEAVIGAAYLDGGLDAMRPWVERELGPRLALATDAGNDPKTRLQERLQSRGDETPRYATVAERGPDHAKEFEVEVRAGDAVLGVGAGRSKREAEQAAARAGLDALEGEA